MLIFLDLVYCLCRTFDLIMVVDVKINVVNHNH